MSETSKGWGMKVVHALADEAAHAVSRKVLGRGQDGGSVAALLDDPP
jgi:hypothetical protein